MALCTGHFHLFMNSDKQNLPAHKEAVSDKINILRSNYYWFVYAVLITNLLHLLRKSLEIHFMFFCHRRFHPRVMTSENLLTAESI